MNAADTDLSDILVVLIGNHPHAGKTARPTGKVIKPVGLNRKMYELKFDGDTGWGPEACFARLSDMQIVEPAHLAGNVGRDAD